MSLNIKSTSVSVFLTEIIESQSLCSLEWREADTCKLVVSYVCEQKGAEGGGFWLRDSLPETSEQASCLQRRHTMSNRRTT